jgi:long-chain fatty acid transport protein
MLRGGLGFDESPATNTYRNVQMPDNNRYVVAFGSHFKATKTVAFDLSWLHLFVPQARINPPPQVAGNEVVTTSGQVNGGADVFGAQITWNLT